MPRCDVERIGAGAAADGGQGICPELRRRIHRRFFGLLAHAPVTVNQAPGRGDMMTSALPAASATPVAAATPLMVSLVPSAANICDDAAPALMIHITWPPTAGGNFTISAAVAHTAIRLTAALRMVAFARPPPARAV